jgi:hypothetical protein
MNLGHTMDKHILNGDEFVRVRDNRLEIFVMGLVNELILHNKNGTPITSKYIIKYICDKVKEILVDPSINFIVLDCRLENHSTNILAKGIINSLKLQPNQVLVLTSTDHKGILEGYDCIVDLTADIDFAFFYTKLLERNIDWENIEIDIPIISLLSRPTEKRARLTKDLADLCKDKARLSFGNVADNVIVGISDKDRKMYEEILHPYPFPLLQNIDNKISDCPNEFLYIIALQHEIENDIFQSLVNVVTETNEFDSDNIMLSEKTFKAFAWHQIPIFNATKGHVEIVRSLGFDLFDDIINHNYDAAPNNYMQKLKILNEISKFLKNYNSINDINNLRKGIFHRLQANNDLLYKLYKYKQRPQEPWPYFG